MEARHQFELRHHLGSAGRHGPAIDFPVGNRVNGVGRLHEKRRYKARSRCALLFIGRIVLRGAVDAVDREKFITFILHRDDGLRRRSEEKWHEDAILRIGRLKVEEHHFRPAQHLRGGAPRAEPVRSARSTFRGRSPSAQKAAQTSAFLAITHRRQTTATNPNEHNALRPLQCRMLQFRRSAGHKCLLGPAFFP